MMPPGQNYAGGTTTSRYYTGLMEYNGSTLDIIHNEEGLTYYTLVNGIPVYEYEYYLKDHLGNIRNAFTISNNAAVSSQYTEYYPFGMVSVSSTSGSSHNDYLYNGKELQRDLGMEWYDYGARFYDPQIGRWNAQDPLGENTYDYTPYRYGFNNPVSIIDPDGMSESVSEMIQDAWDKTQPGENRKFSYENGEPTGNSDGEPFRVRVASPMNETSIASGILDIFNPFTPPYGTFQTEVDGNIYSFPIEDDGTIDLNNYTIIFECNPIKSVSALRRLSLLRTPTRMARLVRNPNFIKNQGLRSFLAGYYRVEATYGNGNAASALMYEARTGQLLSRSGPLQKVASARKYLISLLNSNYSTLTNFEKQLIVRELFEANRAINLTMSPESKYIGPITKDVLKALSK